jgi:hypothetical protein
MWVLTSVAANIVRANGQIGNLEVLDTVDVEALIEHTVLNDAVALLRGHGASLISQMMNVAGVERTYTKTMPSRLNMSLHPFLNMLDILLTIL